MKNLALFLSGTGSNAKTICSYFQSHPEIKVCLLLSNKQQSGAKSIAAQFDLPFLIFNREEFYNSDSIMAELIKYKIDYIILAGFLWLMPIKMLKHYHNRVINIHPALLPKYGGKGMYGHFVHEAVYDNKEKESGITIHLCNEEYDKGIILFQETVALDKNDTPELIAKKVLSLEHRFFPLVIENYICQNKPETSLTN